MSEPLSAQPIQGHTLRALLSLVALALAPLSYLLLIDQPFLRSSALSAWLLIAAAVVLALSAARRDRRAWVRAVAVFQLAAVPFSLWAFFIASKLPATNAELLARAPDFTLLDQDGNPVTLSTELASGPVLLVFYRGHW